MMVMMVVQWCCVMTNNYDGDDDDDDDYEEKYRFKSKSPSWFSVKICRSENNETVKRPQSHCSMGS